MHSGCNHKVLHCTPFQHNIWQECILISPFSPPWMHLHPIAVRSAHDARSDSVWMVSQICSRLYELWTLTTHCACWHHFTTCRMCAFSSNFPNLSTFLSHWSEFRCHFLTVYNTNQMSIVCAWSSCFPFLNNRPVTAGRAQVYLITLMMPAFANVGSYRYSLMSHYNEITTNHN